MADWRELYRATVIEMNPKQLEQLIKETEDAIFRRVRQLAGSSDSKKERRKMAEASAALWTLRTEKTRLGNPENQIRLKLNPLRHSTLYVAFLLLPAATMSPSQRGAVRAYL
jgi:hypothetical protein